MLITLFPGLAGAAMQGWLKGNGMTAVQLPRDGQGNAATGLKCMARALKEGHTVGIALDGPHGPARVVRPGALLQPSQAWTTAQWLTFVDAVRAENRPLYLLADSAEMEAPLKAVQARYPVTAIAPPL